MPEPIVQRVAETVPPRIPRGFAIPRTVGWLPQWQEMVTDPEQKIARPPQIFVG